MGLTQKRFNEIIYAACNTENPFADIYDGSLVRLKEHTSSVLSQIATALHVPKKDIRNTIKEPFPDIKVLNDNIRVMQVLVVR